MNLKIKHLTLLTLLITALPFTTFTPLWAMELGEDFGEGLGGGSDADAAGGEGVLGDGTPNAAADAADADAAAASDAAFSTINDVDDVANLGLPPGETTRLEDDQTAAASSGKDLADDLSDGGPDIVDPDASAPEGSDAGQATETNPLDPPDDGGADGGDVMAGNTGRPPKEGQINNQAFQKPGRGEIDGFGPNAESTGDDAAGEADAGEDGDEPELTREEARDELQKGLDDVNGKIKAQKEKIAKARARGEDTTDLEKNLEDLKAQKAGIEKRLRVFDDSLTKLGRGIKYGIEAFGKFLWMATKFVGMILFQALAFTVPSALEQMEVERLAKEALLETIASAQPFGNLWLQIPPQLINSENPSSTPKLYCEVPNGKTQSAGYFNAAFLATANFYVASAPEQAFWGTSYIGGPSFDGTMVCLNNGWQFVGDGIDANAAQPTVPLVSAATGQDVESFTNSFVNTSQATTYSHTPSLRDWVTLDTSALMAKPVGHTLNDPNIKAMLLTPPTSSSSSTDTLPGTQGFQLYPPVFNTTISLFRQATTVPGFGGLQLTQMQGTGFLNTVLDSKVDASNPALQTALQQLATADKNYKLNLSIKNSSVSYSQTALNNLQSAQQAVAAALKNQNIDTLNYGFSPEANINARNVYIYEIVADDFSQGTMTPSLHALLRNASVDSYVPLKEYVVCLNSEQQIVPLLIPQEVKGSSGYTVTMVPNPNIVYISSLTTGMTYEMGYGQGTQSVTNSQGVKTSSVKLLSPYISPPGAPSPASSAWTALQQSLASDQLATEIVQQIVSMANYTTENMLNGPFKTYSGYTFEKIPLSDLLGNKGFQAQKEQITQMAKILTQSANTGELKEQAASLSSGEKENILSQIYIYRVSKNGLGALSKNSANSIYDYVVPVSKATSGGNFQISPLGTDQITGGVASDGVEALFSLITGKGYDPDYNPLPLWYTVTMKPLNRESYFTITGEGTYGYQMATQAGQQSETITLNVNGKQVQETIKIVPNVYMGTAFMPTHFNPANRIIMNYPGGPDNEPGYWREQYETAKANLASLGVQFEQAISNASSTGLQGLAEDTIEYGINVLNSQGAVAGAKQLQADQFSASQITALQQQSQLTATANQLSTAQATYDAINKVINTNMFNGQVFSPPLTAWASESQVLEVPPLYFLFFPNFSYCIAGGTAAATSSSSGAQGINLNWVATQPCQSQSNIPLPLGKGKGSLMNVLPKAFSGFDVEDNSYYASAKDKTTGKTYDSIIAAYTKWSKQEERTTYWAQTGLMGPFNFTQRQYNNVYITATSRADVANGNFFYTASGFPSTDLFVYATGPVDSSTVTSLSQLQDIGAAYANLEAGNYLINVGTGQLYAPYVAPGAQSTDTGNMAPNACRGAAPLNNYECSLQPVGQNVLPGGTSSTLSSSDSISMTRTGRQIRFNPQDVLTQVLKTQGLTGTPLTFSQLSSSLQQAITMAQQSAQQQITKSLGPVYFAGLQLSLSQESFEDGTYIYEVGSDQVQDYVVVAEFVSPNSNSLSVFGGQPVTPYTQFMISLVTGTLYTQNSSPLPGYMANILQSSGTGSKSSISQWLMNFLQSLNKVTINADLFKQINLLAIQFEQQVNSMKSGSVLLNNAPTLSVAQVSQLTEVTQPVVNVPSVPSSKLVKIGEKYYLQISSTIGKSTLVTYFDFNATNDATDARYGVYYREDGTNPNYLPVSALKGFELDAMRASYGVSVSSSGVQELTVPVTQLALPRGSDEEYLIPTEQQSLPSGRGTYFVPLYGQSGTYMKAAPAPMNYFVNTQKGQAYYYYVHQVTQAYYALVRDIAGMRYSNGRVYAKPSYFVDLMSGDEYNLDGSPKKTETHVAYRLYNKTVYVQDPLFVWGQVNNTGTGPTLNVLANGGQGYTQYMYVPFSIAYKFQSPDKSSVVSLGYQIKTGPSPVITPVSIMSSQGGTSQSILPMSSGINTTGMPQYKQAEIALNSAVQETSKAGWGLYEIEYKVSPDGTPDGAFTVLEMPGYYPKRYQIGDQKFVAGGENITYPVPGNSPFDQALAQGTAFVGDGMGNRSSTTAIPSGVATFGNNVCGVMDSQEQVLLGFVSTLNTDFYTLFSSAQPGQPATYQSSNGESQFLGLVTNYSLTGQQSGSGGAVQSPYIVFEPAENTQAIYSFDYSNATDDLLNALKTTMNVVTNVEGSMQLMPQVNLKSQSSVTPVQGSIGSQYLIGLTDPLPTLVYQIPPVDVAEKYFAKDTTQYALPGGQTMSCIDIFKNMVSSFGVGAYVNYYNGAVYERSRNNSNYLYPTGLSVSPQSLNVIKKQFKNALATPNSLTLALPASNVTLNQVLQGGKKPPVAPGSTSSSTTPPPPSSTNTVSKTPPPPPAIPVAYTLPSQPIGKAFVELRDSVKSLLSKFFTKVVAA